MRRLLFPISLGAFFGFFLSDAVAKPTLVSQKPACIDGFCIELGGQNLLNDAQYD